MKALVLSGAGNFGAMQAGALEVLLKAFRPQMVVGSSAGALNAIYVALDPSPAGARKLQSVWHDSARLAAGFSNPFVVLRQVVQGADGLVPSEVLAAFLRRHLPDEIKTYEELRAIHGIRVYSMAVDMKRARLVGFGDDPEDSLLDGAMASTAVPPYLPPWVVDGVRYLDGGIFSKLPIWAAIDRGADRVVALDVVGAIATRPSTRGVLGVSGYSVSLMVEAQAGLEVESARQSGIDLRLMRLKAPEDIAYWDYRHPDRLIELGRTKAKDLLAGEPLRWSLGWLRRLRRLTSAIQPPSEMPTGLTE